MRNNHKWVAPCKRRPIDTLIVLQAIGAGIMFLVGLGIVAMTIIAAGGN